MAFTQKRLASGFLTATLTTVLYTNPGSVTTIIKMIWLVNTDTVAQAVTIRAPGSTAGNEILSAYSMQPGEVLPLVGHWILNTTETLTGGAATGSKVACMVTGVEG